MDQNLNIVGETRDYVEDDTALPPQLLATVQAVRAMPVPRPTPEDSARLLARLLAAEPEATRRAAGRRAAVLPALRVARWRVRLLGPQFWVASVMLLLAGAGWTRSMQHVNSAAPLILLAPLSVVLGLAHALRTSAAGLRAVETSCPVGYVEVTAGLALSIVAFDCMLALLATALLALAHWAPFGLLLAAWIGPLLFLAGVSLPVALRFGLVPAIAVGAGPWLLLAIATGLRPTGVLAMPSSPVSLTIHLLTAAIGLLLLLTTMVVKPIWLAPINGARA